jgi:transcriptional regulator with XRE-family HTH domain
MTQGQRFKRILDELGLTQIELASKVGISKQSINNVASNKGNFSVDIYIKLLTEYNVSLNYLLAGIEPMFLTKRDKQLILSDDELYAKFKEFMKEYEKK